MHLKVVKGKPLYVGLAEKKDARQVAPCFVGICGLGPCLYHFLLQLFFVGFRPS